MRSDNRYMKSIAAWQESAAYLVPGSSTISKHPKLYTHGGYPIYLTEGKGARVRDIDGNEYLDFQSALGAQILGLCRPEINLAVKRQLSKGTLFSLASPLQIELARLICEAVPCAERVRILKNGSDATSASVRIARAFTGRDKIASCHFHGWHDWCYVGTGLGKGIPQSLSSDLLQFPYNDLPALERIFADNRGEVAGVIMEPVCLDEPEPGYLEGVKACARRHGALLIFDEVVTGFRFARGGAQAYFGVTPDLCCLAKALGNGAPISAVAGSREIMEATADVITSMTYAEETTSVAAAIATLKVLRKKPVVEHIWKLGQLFQHAFNRMAESYGIPVKCIGLPPRLQLAFREGPAIDRLSLKAYFLQESARRGMIFGNCIFMNYSHRASDIERALSVCERVFRVAASRGLRLEGARSVELW